jgi:hypothetical protein
MEKTEPKSFVNKFGNKIYCYKISSHTVCSALMACGFTADHTPEYYNAVGENTKIDYDTVWTDLLVHQYHSASRARDTDNDVVFFNDGEYLTYHAVPITRVHTEVYDDLLQIDNALYEGLMSTIRRQCKLYRLALVVSISTALAIIGGILWKKSL